MQGKALITVGAVIPSQNAGGNELESARRYAAESRSLATRKAYASDWRDFEIFCFARGFDTLPAAPETVASYLASLADAGRKSSTIRRRVVAIGCVHKFAGYVSPTENQGVKATISGIERTIGSASTKKAALTADLVAKVLRKIPDDLTGLRDKALIMVGFAAALRRSELVALDRIDIRPHPKGLTVIVRRSKTDQRGEGKTKAIPHGRRLHVAAALDGWLAAAGITSGPIFRGVRGATVLAGRLSTKQVGRIVQARAAAIGLDPTSFGGHSLRSGFITSAADTGATLQSIANHAAHAKLDTTLGYVQVQDAFANNPGKKFL